MAETFFYSQFYRSMKLMMLFFLNADNWMSLKIILLRTTSQARVVYMGECWTEITTTNACQFFHLHLKKKYLKPQYQHFPLRGGNSRNLEVSEVKKRAFAKGPSKKKRKNIIDKEQHEMSLKRKYNEGSLERVPLNLEFMSLI